MVWDKTLPIEGALAPTYNNIMRADKEALEAALNAWMYFVTGGTQTGQPRQGSARPYFQDSVPTARLDGNYFDSTDLGTIWIDSNSSPDNQFNILTAADGAGTETWTPISTEIIAVMVAAVHTWAAAQTFAVSPAFTKGIVANNSYLTGRNNAGNANVDMIKVNTSDGVTMGAVTILPDTSALATSAAPTEDNHLSNKAYSDTKEPKIITQAAASILGPRTANDTDSNPFAAGSVYKAQCDGILTVRDTYSGGTADTLEVFTDSSNPPTALEGESYDTDGNTRQTITLFIPKDDYWKVVWGHTVSIKWQPVGTGGCVKQ